MACFLAPTAEAIIVSVIKKNAQKKEEAALKNGTASAEASSKSGISWSRKLFPAWNKGFLELETRKPCSIGRYNKF